MVLLKKLTGFLMVCMLLVCMMAGCGSSDANDSAGNAGAGSAEAEKKEGSNEENAGNGAEEAGGEIAELRGDVYSFAYNDVEIIVDTDIVPIVDKLGEPDEYFEEPSCAAQGIAKIYTYPGIRIETYPDGDNDLVACVILKDDTVATTEGVDLSMGKEDIIAVYGTDCEEAENSMTYEKNGTKLHFILNGDDIASIEYNSPVLN